MTRAGLAKVLTALAVAGALPYGVHACQTIPLVLPTKFQTMADRQPTLVWQGESHVRYRVQVAAVLPESRVVVSHDTEVVGNQFKLPAPLPVERAGIKVLVTRGCDGVDAQDLHAQGAWFFVDMRDACAMDGATLKETAAGLSWAAVRGASGYSARVFMAPSASTGSLVPVHQSDLREPQWPLPAEPSPKAAGMARKIATVQAVCDGQPGRPVSLPLTLR
jgi:hypothetical protein